MIRIFIVSRFFASTGKTVQIWDFIRKICPRWNIWIRIPADFNEADCWPEVKISMKFQWKFQWRLRWNFNEDFNVDINEDFNEDFDEAYQRWRQKIWFSTLSCDPSRFFWKHWSFWIYKTMLTNANWHLTNWNKSKCLPNSGFSIVIQIWLKWFILARSVLFNQSFPI